MFSTSSNGSGGLFGSNAANNNSKGELNSGNANVNTNNNTGNVGTMFGTSIGSNIKPGEIKSGNIGPSNNGPTTVTTNGGTTGDNTGTTGNTTGINNSTSTSRLLKDLLESANNLPKLNNYDLGTINLTINELQRKSEELIKNKDKHNFTKAHYFLASSGISAEEIENELKSIEPTRINKILKPKHIGIDQFLNTKKEENILNTIEQSLTSASKDFDDFINKTITIDWKLKRNELRKSLLKDGSVKSLQTNDLKLWNNNIGNGIILDKHDHDKKIIRTYTREKFERYATIIYHLNEERLNNNFFAVFANFEEINKSQNDLKSKQLTDIYKNLIDLTNELGNKKISQEQIFYKSDNNEDDEIKRNELIIDKSKKFLQDQFYQYMEEIYNKDDNKVNFQPPNNINKVKFFIDKIIMKNHHEFNETTLKINGIPIWSLIYYLMRCGLYNDCLTFIIENNDLFHKFDKNFPIYFKNFIKDDKFKLPNDLNERINKEFNQQFSLINQDFQNKFDPYKYAVYKIIGKCDLSKKTLPNVINLSIEDWLWFHLSIINESNDFENDLIFENYKLINLQKQIISLGPNKLNASSNNPMYLKSLIMTGLYELAVQYTYEYLNEIDAVHLAIGLNYYGLLKISSLNNGELITLNPKTNHYEINFSKIIASFIRTFKISDPKVACQYLILISMSKGGNSLEEISKCHESLRELILISREFNLLLGKLDNDTGNKISGILEIQRSLINLPDLNDFYNKIIEISGKKCEEEGRIFDALLLFQLCQDYDQVLIIINKLLSELISSTELDKSLVKSGNYEYELGGIQNEDVKDTIENNIVLLSQHINNVFNKNTSILSKLNKSYKRTTDLLVSIISIRENFLAKKFNSVLIEIENLNILPININDDLIKIRTMSEYLQNSMDNNILKVIPVLLIIIMSSINQLNNQILSKNFKSLSNEFDEINNLKIIGKNCMIFAGMIQYKMPRETYSLLVQLESSL